MGKTSVEWLVDQLKERGYAGEFPPYLLFEQAKAMEKQQMKSIYSPTIMQNEDGKLYVKDFEQYYDETFDNK